MGVGNYMILVQSSRDAVPLSTVLILLQKTIGNIGHKMSFMYCTKIVYNLRIYVYLLLFFISVSLYFEEESQEYNMTSNAHKTNIPHILKNGLCMDVPKQ